MTKLTWKDCLKIGVTATAVYLLIYYWSAGAGFVADVFDALGAFALGLAIAYVVNILMSFYERHYFKKSNAVLAQKSRRPVCLLLAFLSVIVMITIIISVVVPGVTNSVTIVVNNAPAAVQQLMENDLVQKYLPEVYKWVQTLNWTGIAEQISSFLKNNYNGIIGTVSSAASGMVSFFLGIIFSIYLLVGKEKLQAQCKRLFERFLPAKFLKKLYYFLAVMNRSFHSFIVGQVTEAVILGGLCTIGLLLLKIPYAVLIGVLVGFTALIPIVGAYIGAGVGILMIITDTPAKAITFVIFLVILQQVEGNLIYPRVVGSSIGLPGIWVLAAVTVGGGVGGIVGMLAAVPLTAGLYQIIREDLNKHESGRVKIPPEPPAQDAAGG